MNDQGGTNQTLPASPNTAPGIPGNFDLIIFDGFGTLNTKETRPAIGPDECYILDNFIPLGKNNARTMFDVGPAAYTRTSGSGGISYFAFGNIADVPLGIIFQADGSIIRYNTSTQSRTSIAGAGTIVTPSAQLGVAQWGSQYIGIVAPQTNGYFLYDGTAFYRSGTVAPQVILTNSGFGYTGVPNMGAWGGSGTGATFTATVTSGGSISQIFVATPGSGYSATDAAIIAFSGGGNSSMTALASTSVSGGKLSGISMNNVGAGYGAQTVITVIGGGGIGAQVTATISGTVTAPMISNPGQGYLSAPTVVFTDPNNSVAQATLTLMPFGIQGTCIETFSQRVWIGNGSAPSNIPPKGRVLFSAPNDPANFAVSAGGGAFLATDSFTRVGYNSLKQTNGFLYLIGDSSVNTISGVQTNGATTTFSNQNVDPQIGSPWPDTVQVFGRSVPFGNTFGVHALYGGAVQKVSSPLDGIYTTVTPAGSPPSYSGLIPSSAVCIIFGIHVYIELLPILDQVTGQQVNKLMCWDGKAWWTAQESVNLIRIATQEIDSQMTAWGSDGISLFRLFQNPSSLITKTIQSKLWEQPSYITIKRSQNISGMFLSRANDTVNFTASVDTEMRSTSIAQSSLFAANWTATGGLPANWTATGGIPAIWQSSGLATFIQALENSGTVMGMTLSTTAMDFTLLSLTTTVQRPYEMLI